MIFATSACSRSTIGFGVLAGANRPTQNRYSEPGTPASTVVGTSKRSSVMPQVPTTVEAGVPGSEYLFWVGLFAPAKTPRPVVERLQAEVAKIMAAPDLKERLDKLGAEPFTMPSADFDRFLADETAKAQQVVKAAGIKVD